MDRTVLKSTDDFASNAYMSRNNMILIIFQKYLDDGLLAETQLGKHKTASLCSHCAARYQDGHDSILNLELTL